MSLYWFYRHVGLSGFRPLPLTFKYRKYSSVTSTLLDVEFSSFDTEMFNSRISLTSQLRSSSNNIIKHVCLILDV